MKVAWPYVTLKVRGADGALVIREFYKEAPVPAGADKEDLARLIRKGAVVDEDAIVTDTPPYVEEPASAAPVEPQVVAQIFPDRPADNASKALWVDYAVARRDEGVSESEARTSAEAMTKADLITLHG